MTKHVIVIIIVGHNSIVQLKVIENKDICMKSVWKYAFKVLKVNIKHSSIIIKAETQYRYTSSSLLS